MKQWRIVSGAEVEPRLELAEAAMPEPQAGEVRVRVAGVGVNRADLLQMRGLYPAPAGAPAVVPGLEFSGVVERVHESVTGVAVGDAVMGLVPGGAYAEYLCVPAAELLTVPAAVGVTDAAAIPEPFLTAWRALDAVAALRAGECVVIRPGTAAVGQAAAQIAHRMGATVIATSRGPGALDALAAGVPWYPLAEADAAGRDRLFAQLGVEGADVLLDMLGGGGAFGFGVSLLRPEGRLVGIGLMAGARDDVNLGALLRRRLTLSYMTMRSLDPSRRRLLTETVRARLVPLFDSGHLRPLPVRRFPFDDAPAALALLSGGGHRGRLVLEIGDAARGAAP